MARTLRLAFAIGLLWGLLPLCLGRHWLGLDLLRMDMGGMCEWRNLLFSGAPPWIAPSLGMGAPFAADPLQGFFYPVKWLYFWLPGFFATDLHVAVHLAIACAGAALLARSFGLGRRASLLLGVAYLFSGTLNDLARHSPYLVGGAWLPWSWACARLLRGRKSAGFGLAASLGMMLLGGDAFTWLWGFAIAGLEALGSARWLRLAGFSVLGGAIGLVAWIPAWRELSITGRRDGISLETALSWSWSPLDFPGVVLAGVFKQGSLPGGSLWNLLHSARSGGPLSGGPWNESPFLGFLALAGVVAVVISAIRRPTLGRRWAVPLIVFGLSAVLALGSNLPLAGWIYREVPFLTNLRYPAKHWVAINLAALLLAGAGLQRLPVRRVAGMGLGICLASVLFLGAKAPGAGTLLAWAALPSALALGLGFALRGRRWALGLMVAELACAAMLSVEWMPREQAQMEWFSPLKVVSQEWQDQKGSPAVFCISNQVQKFGLAQTDGHEDLASLLAFQRLVAMPQLNACDGMRVAQGYSILRPDIPEKINVNLDHLAGGPGALGCTHLVSVGEPSGQYPEIEAVLGSRLRIEEITDPVPQYFAALARGGIEDPKPFVLSLQAKSSPRGLLGFFAGGHKPPATLPDVALPPAVAGESPSPSRHVVRFAPDATARGTLVVGVRTIFAAGWRAFQGGTELRTVAAGGVFLAALVRDPGLGPVEFRYDFGSLFGLGNALR